MTTVEQIKARKDSLLQRVRSRWDERSAERAGKLRDIERRGILAAAGTISAARRMSHTTVAEGRTFEALVGGDDTDHINFLTRGWRAGRSVCRIVFGNTAIGSGFLIAPGILITNNHVVTDQRDALGFSAEFDFERDIDGNPMTPRRFAFDPERLFVTSPQELLDFTIVALRMGSSDGQEIARHGWLPMDERIDKILEGEPVVVIQHPLGREKRICLFNSELEFRAPDNFIQYTTDTELGSSGSPAFNRHWQVVGLHHASVPTGDTRRAKPLMANEGVRVSSIIRALREGSGAGAPLIEYPAGARQDALALITDPRVLRDGRPTAPVDVGIPAAPAARPAPQLEAAPTVIRRRLVTHYAGLADIRSVSLRKHTAAIRALLCPCQRSPIFSSTMSCP
jgi:endonuclease G